MKSKLVIFLILATLIVQVSADSIDDLSYRLEVLASNARIGRYISGGLGIAGGALCTSLGGVLLYQGFSSNTGWEDVFFVIGSVYSAGGLAGLGLGSIQLLNKTDIEKLHLSWQDQKENPELVASAYEISLAKFGVLAQKAQNTRYISAGVSALASALAFYSTSKIYTDGNDYTSSLSLGISFLAASGFFAFLESDLERSYKDHKKIFEVE